MLVGRQTFPFWNGPLLVTGHVLFQWDNWNCSCYIHQETFNKKQYMIQYPVISWWGTYAWWRNIKNVWGSIFLGHLVRRIYCTRLRIQDFQHPFIQITEGPPLPWSIKNRIGTLITNGPLRKLLELLDTQVFFGVRGPWVLLEIFWTITFRETKQTKQEKHLKTCCVLRLSTTSVPNWEVRRPIFQG